MRYFTPLLVVLLCTCVRDALVTTLSLPTAGLGLHAQIRYGTFTYLASSEPIRPAAETPEEEMRRRQMREMMAQLRTNGAFDRRFTVTFAPDGFSFLEEMKQQDAEVEKDGMTISIIARQGDPNHYFTDTERGTYTNSVNLSDRHFLVAGEVAPLEWRLTGATVPPSEATSGLDLKIATAITAEGDSLVAGYAPALPVAVGPKNYYGLPGAIVTLDVYGERYRLTYTMTELQPSSAPLVPPVPVAGKPVSPEKFAEHRERMNKLHGRTVRRVERQ